MANFYATPTNPGNVLGYGAVHAGEHGVRRICSAGEDHRLSADFDATEVRSIRYPVTTHVCLASADVLFGDIGSIGSSVVPIRQ